MLKQPVSPLFVYFMVAFCPAVGKKDASGFVLHAMGKKNPPAQKTPGGFCILPHHFTMLATLCLFPSHPCAIIQSKPLFGFTCSLPRAIWHAHRAWQAIAAAARMYWQILAAFLVFYKQIF